MFGKVVSCGRIKRRRWGERDWELGRIGNERRDVEKKEEEEEKENEINRKGEQNKVDRMVEPKKRMPRTAKCFSLFSFLSRFDETKLYPAITTRRENNSGVDKELFCF